MVCFVLMEFNSSEGVIPFIGSRRKMLILPYCPNTTQILVSILSVCREKSYLEDNHVL